MTNVPKSIREKQMFMSMNRILLKKVDFLKSTYFFEKRGIFLKEFLKKHGILCQKTDFLKVRTF